MPICPFWHFLDQVRTPPKLNNAVDVHGKHDNKYARVHQRPSDMLRPFYLNDMMIKNVPCIVTCVWEHVKFCVTQSYLESQSTTSIQLLYRNHGIDASLLSQHLKSCLGLQSCTLLQLTAF